MLYPPEGGKKVAYTRPSTMAKWNDDKAGLINWTASLAMIGMAKSKSLQARLAAIVARSQEDPYRENKKALRELVDNATTLAQAQGRADYGTSLHSFVELLDAGTLDWDFVPDKLKGPLEAYREATAHMRHLDAEVFVAVDEVIDGKKVRAAGSMDGLFEHPELGVVATDLKTGTDEPKYPLATLTQVAIYTRGKRYRDKTFPGTPAFEGGEPNPDGTAWRSDIHPELNKTTGVLIHCPIEPVDGQYICHLYALPLEKGWEAVRLGLRVQNLRRVKVSRM